MSIEFPQHYVLESESFVFEDTVNFTKSDLNENSRVDLKIYLENQKFTQFVDWTDIVTHMREYRTREIIEEIDEEFYRYRYDKSIHIYSNDNDLVFNEEFIQQVIDKNKRLDMILSLYDYTRNDNTINEDSFRESNYYRSCLIDYIVDILFHHNKESDYYVIRYDSNLNLYDEFKLTDSELDKKKYEIESQVNSLKKELEEIEN